MDANPGEPWSKTDIDDLKASLAFGNGIAATANMLCRDEDEVREKLVEPQLDRPIIELGSWPAGGFPHDRDLSPSASADDCPRPALITE